MNRSAEIVHRLHRVVFDFYQWTVGRVHFRVVLRVAVRKLREHDDRRPSATEARRSWSPNDFCLRSFPRPIFWRFPRGWSAGRQTPRRRLPRSARARAGDYSVYSEPYMMFRSSSHFRPRIFSHSLLHVQQWRQTLIKWLKHTTSTDYIIYATDWIEWRGLECGRRLNHDDIDYQ